jgi:uncharacterized GH25 family protein
MLNQKFREVHIVNQFVYALSVGLLCINNHDAQAHETWLLPSSFRIAANETVRFDLTSGMDFPSNDTAIKAERVERARYRLNDKWSNAMTNSPSESSLVLEARPQQNGIATVTVELKPKEIDLSDALVEEYFQEIAASDEIRKAWNQIKGKKPWKEIYSKHAKSFIAIGNVSHDKSWKLASGLKLDLVPQVNPFDAKVGSEFEVTLLRDGKPLPNFSIGLILESQPDRIFAKTNEQGIARFKLSKPGRALLCTVDLRLKSDDTWESDFSTLTFAVGE